ncbi:T9SS type A sorting domain-containing protein [Olleya namhaensis]|uniref:Por secretion system C-terminal sorting domain-containing protein n=1 Tax=Olleya namhaensis TaxID=1144750 RepID=A0A1I3RYE5_9FLAO|nr:T9SS type A sorting domain-containing protein [Olleya namhaensis]SFJ50286.1 Por secretion system C-terminal sorting domain-containing protein [Olleya namhaensis]
MYKKLHNQTLNFRALFILVALAFSVQTFAFEDTYCGSIAGFEFSNGSSSTAISNNQSYYIGDLPSDFYIDLQVNGYSNSARYYVRNLDTGQCYNINENYAPYTFPGGNGAWNLGCGNFEVKSKIYKYSSCSSYCDSETIRFTITCSNPCGDISGLELSNGTDTVTVVDHGVYELDTLPNNFYADLIVNGQSESASLKVENLTTGQVFNVGENYLPYTAPGGNAAWSYGTGNFKITSKIFATNYCQGAACDENVIYFTINNTICGEVDGFEFSNFSDAAVSIVDGASYDLDNLPADFNINLLTSGNVESAYFTLTNLETGDVYTKTENATPYTYPGATTASWAHGCGTFKVCSSIYAANNAGGAECDSSCVTFTINCEEPCGTISEFAFSNTTDNVTIAQGGVYNIADLPEDFYVDAIVDGGSESVRLTATNLDTNETLVIIENVVPYTYPAGGVAWSLGLGNFQIQAELFSADYNGGTLCDTQTISFALVDVLQCEDVSAGTGSLSTGFAVVTPGVTVSVSVITNNDAVLPVGYQLGTVLTKGAGLTIEGVSESTTMILPVSGGNYKVHTLAYDPTTFNLNDIELGDTTAFYILDLIENNEICADLDANGNPLLIVTTGSTDRTTGATQLAETKGNDNLDAGLKLYPNPVVNELHVNINLLQGEVLTYSMMDVNGKQVLAGRLSSNTNMIQTNQLAGGLYILRMTSETRSFTKKVVVRK